MPSQTWGTLTPDEKIEDLRRDLLKLFDAVNFLAGDLQRFSALAADTDRKMSQALEAIEALQSKAG